MTDVDLGQLVTIIGLALAWSAIVTTLTPPLLSRGTWWHHQPGLALFGWWAALSSVVVASVLAFLALCLSLVIIAANVRSASARFWVQALLALAVVTAIAVFCYLTGCSERAFRSHRSVGRHVDALVRTRAVRVERRTGYELVVLDTTAPLAVSVGGGRTPRILLSRGLIDTLTAEELAAVIWHERAHLELRHDCLVQLSALVATLVPWVPASRRLAGSVHLLTELAADDVAVARVGGASVLTAMDRLREAEGNGSLQLRAVRIQPHG